jgi:hypothetical protein
VCFENEDDAAYVWSILEERFRTFGLSLHPKKTRSFAFRPPVRGGDGGGPTFDFLGFTAHWRRTRFGNAWRVAFKTRGARLRKAIKAITEWCRSHLHDPVEEQHRALVRRLAGHMNYFAVNGNTRALQSLLWATMQVWRKWLNRRSQRGRMTKGRFWAMLRKLPLPRPKIRVQIWSSP